MRYLPFLISLSIALLFFKTPGYAQVSVGDEAPDFTYSSLSGIEISLSDYKGKVVYIFFYGAGCPHCKENGPITEHDIYQLFKNNDNFVALGLDTWNYSRSANQNFQAVTGISYPLLLSARQSMLDYYGNTTSYDRSVVISKEGTVAYKGTNFVFADTAEVTDTIEESLSEVVTSSEGPTTIPDRLSLSQNYPNPFNPATTIRYTLQKPGRVALKIYNILGAEVATLVDGWQSAGSKTLRWDATSPSGNAPPSGIYIYQLTTADQQITKKMILLK
ncbi:MAG: redoxin domain-containing protein [Balneolaceae bacterium]|nr:redoxin domain-containing protein [Balneolaceae bacterium]